LIPSKELLDDKDNIEVTTEVIKLRMEHMSSDLMNYLRSVLMPNYKATGLPDMSEIMVVYPRLVAYEVMVFDFAVKLLELVQATELNNGPTLEEDLKRYDSGAGSCQERTILLHNINSKMIVANQINLLKVLKSIM